MKPDLKIVTIESPGILDIPEALRNLAKQIENGDLDAAYNLAWVIDCGEGHIEAGIMGKVANVSSDAYLLFALAQRYIENSAMKP